MEGAETGLKLQPYWQAVTVRNTGQTPSGPNPDLKLTAGFPAASANPYGWALEMWLFERTCRCVPASTGTPTSSSHSERCASAKHNSTIQIIQNNHEEGDNGADTILITPFLWH